MARCMLPCNKVRSSARGPTRNPRVCLAVRASAEPGRRQVLQGLVTTLGIIPVAAANAVTPISIVDDRSSKRSMDRFDEAADFQEDIRVRRGDPQARFSLDDTKARLQESKARLMNVGDEMKARRWSASRNELRNQTGYMRQDLEAMVRAASDEKRARSATKNLLGNIERLDYALAQKNMGDATAAYESVVSAMNDVMAAVG